MDFISTSSQKHVQFFIEERAQLDILRILGKAGASLQIQDKIFDWACQYSRINKLHNMAEETFGYATPSQAGSPFLMTWLNMLEPPATGPIFAMLLSRGGCDGAK